MPSRRSRALVSGPVSLFRHKVRSPVSITLTTKHHLQVHAAMLRTGLSRSDLFGLLVEVFADKVTTADVARVVDA